MVPIGLSCLKRDAFNVLLRHGAMSLSATAERARHPIPGRSAGAEDGRGDR